MFSESKAAGRGEQRGFKHMPHFFPWLCSGLKAHQTGGDLGLRGPFRRSAESHLEDLAPQGKIKEEIQRNEKDKHKKSVPRGNGMGLARRLPLVLRGRHILSEGLGKTKEDGSSKKDPSPELVPNSDSGTRLPVQDGPQDLGNNGITVQDFYSEHSPVRTPGSHLNLPSTPQSDGVGTPLRKYGPLAPIPAPVPPGEQIVQEAQNPKVPSALSVEEDREKLSGYLRRTYRQRDPTFSCWINSSTWGTIDRQQGFKSSVSCPQEKSTDSPSQRDSARPEELPGARFNHRGSFKGDVLSRERPHTDTGFTRTLPGRRKPRPKSDLVQTRGPEQAWVQPRAAGAVDSTSAAANEPGHLGPRCNRKAVRSQIKRVVVNLEQVVGALRNVQQEMKEVVEQIDYLTSAIDLNAQEEEGKMEVGEGRGGGGGRGDVTRPPSNSSSSSTSASTTSGVTVGSIHPPKLSEQEEEEEEEEKAEETGSTPMSTSTLKRGDHLRNHTNPRECGSPTARPTPCTQTTVHHLSEKTPTLHNARTTESSQKRGAPPSYGHLALHASSPINRAGQSQPQPQRPASQSLAPSPRRSSPSPARPPTPGLSPLPVGPPSATSNSPAPPSPLATLSPAFPSPVALSLSLPHPSHVATRALSGSCESPLSRHPSASPPSPSPSPSPARPPTPSGPPGLSETLPARTDREGEESQAHSAGLARLASRESATLPERIRNPPAQGRRGRKPPPYPHSRLFECGRRAKEPRQAPPYPEKRRLLSTTV
ncbi:unnamed protein product [Lota lota]